MNGQEDKVATVLLFESIIVRRLKQAKPVLSASTSMIDFNLKAARYEGYMQGVEDTLDAFKVALTEMRRK